MKIVLDFDNTVELVKAMRLLHTYGMVKTFKVDEETYKALEEKMNLQKKQQLGMDIDAAEGSPMVFRGTPIEKV